MESRRTPSRRTFVKGLAAGGAVVSRFTAVLFVFAAILFWSPDKILKGEDESFDPGKSLAVRLLRKVIPVRDEYAGAHFFVKEAGKREATPLLAGPPVAHPPRGGVVTTFDHDEYV